MDKWGGSWLCDDLGAESDDADDAPEAPTSKPAAKLFAPGPLAKPKPKPKAKPKAAKERVHHTNRTHDSHTSCSKLEVNCKLTKCCQAEDMACMERDQHYAECRNKNLCVPGMIDKGNKKWSCKEEVQSKLRLLHA
jgi:hypothetical protein